MEGVTVEGARAKANRWRVPGFYWVFCNGDWEVARWIVSGGSGFWLFVGATDGGDGDIEVVGDRCPTPMNNPVILE